KKYHSVSSTVFSIKRRSGENPKNEPLRPFFSKKIIVIIIITIIVIKNGMKIRFKINSKKHQKYYQNNQKKQFKNVNSISPSLNFRFFGFSKNRAGSNAVRK